MADQKPSVINLLQRHLPEGLLVDVAWLERLGINRSLRSYYVKSGWLEQPARGVYRRPRGALAWEQVVVSLQMMLKRPFVVGGRRALALQGYEHYMTREVRVVTLTGPDKPPTWLKKLPLAQSFEVARNRALFPGETLSVEADGGFAGLALASVPWGQWDWPLWLSRPERACLEVLDAVPKSESFEVADKLMESAANFSPRRLQELLEACGSVKAKRLFFFFADRHQHAWLKRLDKDAVDLGRGKRSLVPGGRFDSVYQITVPEAYHGLP